MGVAQGSVVDQALKNPSFLSFGNLTSIQSVSQAAQFLDQTPGKTAAVKGEGGLMGSVNPISNVFTPSSEGAMGAFNQAQQELSRRQSELDTFNMQTEALRQQQYQLAIQAATATEMESQAVSFPGGVNEKQPPADFQEYLSRFYGPLTQKTDTTGITRGSTGPLSG